MAEEAFRLSWPGGGGDPGHSPAIIAAALVRTGRKPVDPDLILAREVCAKIWSAWPDMREGYSAGAYDHQLQVQAILAAIKAVRREGERKG